MDTERPRKKRKRGRVYAFLAHMLTAVVLIAAPAAPLIVAKAMP